MKCPNCGAEVKDGSLFCDACGYKFETAAADSTATSGVPAEENVPAKKTGKMIPIVIGGAVVVGAAAFFVSSFLKPNNNKFIDLQAAAVKSAYLDPLETMYKPTKDTVSTDLTLTAQMPGAGQMSDVLDKTALIMKLDGNKQNYTMNVAFRYNNADVLTGLLYTDGKKLDMASPSLNNKVYSGNLVEMTKKLTGHNDDQISFDDINDLQLSEEKQKEIAKRYYDLLRGVLTDKNLTIEKSQKLDFSVSAITSEDAKNALDGKSFTKYTFVPTEEDYKTLMQKLGDTLEKDTDLKDWYSKYQEYEKMAYPQMPTYDEILSKVKENGDNASKNLTDLELKWTVYADDKQARYIRIETKNADAFEMAFAEDGAQTTDCISFGENFSFCNSFTKNGSVCSGSMSFNNYKLNYNNVDTSKPSVLGIFYGSYNAEGVTLEVKEADNATDYEVKVMGATINLNATNSSTAVKPEGDVVDISNYTEEDYQNLVMELSNDFQQLMMSDPNLQELAMIAFGGMF
ncbi:MAG: zinc-ribbon domain-containing protein [[Clostridium] aminophilum]|uniref:zinc-ribbon domain-containing protein n=1 Tax=[Clostridium] aminophilum TaxID=1526 RepID=UPI0026EEE922|nr:zinc-ribbon domain-containing protein [[Clostridium] aminophilum]MDD6196433.1 zinc-ribbon domain-containing protein [[Clostridium] aminophilum]